VNWHLGLGRDTITVSYAAFFCGCGDGEPGQIAHLFARKLSAYSRIFTLARKLSAHNGILTPSDMGRLSILER